MKRLMLRLTMVIALAALTAQALAEMRVERDIEYKTSDDAYVQERCKLDLYLPQGDGFPVVVWFHGGGLTAGEKTGDFEQRLAKWFVEHGIACANVGYRLSPKAKFPAYVEDTAAAVTWVKKNIKNYGGDPDGLFVSGHSAGGYLTAIIGVDPQYLAKHELSPSDLSGLIPVSGQMSTHTTIQDERGKRSETRVIDAAAPLFHVKYLGPPVLVVAGGEDSPDREEVNRDYAKALQDAGHKDVALLVVEGRDHGTIISRVDEPEDVVGVALLEFVREHSDGELEQVTVGSMTPVHRFGDVLLAGQPSREDLALLKEQGFKTVINLRRTSEINWDQAEAVRQLGLNYVHVPFSGGAELTDEVFDKVLATLRDEASGPTLFHCASANRVGAIWYAHRVLDDGIGSNEAEAEARQVGLRTSEYLTRAQDYVARQRLQR